MKLQVIVGSTREGRVSDRVANWVANEAKSLDDTTVEIIDLRDYEMPFFDEPVPPQYNPERKPIAAVKKWLDKLSQADAYVLVTAEYNGSTPAVLKNALDYLDFQFKNKPVTIVSHGAAGGMRAVYGLRVTLANLKAAVLPTSTAVSGRVPELVDESGKLVDEEIRSNPYGPQAALDATLAELKWYSDALSAARD